MCVPVLNNIHFFYKDGREKLPFDNDFFAGVRFSEIHLDISCLTWTELTANNKVKTVRMLAQKIGIHFTAAQRLRLKQGFEIAYKTFFREGDKAIPLEDFFGSIKKGSKKIRLILFKSKVRKTNSRDPVKNFIKILDCAAPDPDLFKKLNSRWWQSYYSSEMRTFLFKFYHNVLGLNARVHHYNPDRNEACTFCTKKKIFPADRETFNHFFWHCPVTNVVLTEFFTANIRFNVGMTEFFFGLDDNNHYCESLMLVFDILKFTLWQMKIRKSIPNKHNQSNDFRYLLDIILGSNNKIREVFNVCDCFRRHGE
jgi:hypothetical protein